MYQDAVGGGGGGVVEEGEAAEYHIMYSHYDPLPTPTPQDTTTTALKLGQAGAKDRPLASVTLAGGTALVPGAELVDVPALSASPPCGAGGGGALAVTTEGLGVAGQRHHSPVAVGGMEAAAAALVTSMVAPGECEGGGSGGRKVIVKLFNSNTFSLDIITDSDGEAAMAPHHVLTRGSALVHAKLSSGTIFPAEDQAGDGEEGGLVVPPAHAPAQVAQEEEAEAAALPCRVMWTCAYCSVMLATSEAMAAHQQVCAKALGDLPPLHTGTSQTTVDALMSPLRPQEEPAYHLKLEGAAESHEVTTTTASEEGGMAEVVAVWVCAVCEEEFPDPGALGHHLPSHSVHQLAAALLQLATPHQRVRPAVAATAPDTATTTTPSTTTTTTATSTTPASPDPLAIVAVDSPTWPSGHPDIKMEEENVDNPGDTPPQTPPQDKPLARRARRRPGPRPQDRLERKRKYTRRKKEEEEEVVAEENEAESQGKEYRSITTTSIITPIATTSTTTTTGQGAPAGPSSSSSSSGGRGSRDPHHCEVCNKKLSSRGNLAKHLIRHRTKKPFECSLCHASFNAKRDCRNHYLQHHTTERPNRCHICGKSYVDKSYLLAHMVFHRDQKAYTCELCGKKFNTSRCVTRHKKRHQEEKRFVCDICFRPFAVKGDLTSHKRKVHSKQTQGAGTARTQPQPQQQLLPNPQQTQPHLSLTAQQPPPQTDTHTPHTTQGKVKELTDFILPEVVASPHILPDQLLPSDLSGGAVGTLWL
ncbi:zinc finger protein 335-like [Eriocheir sinensis]|uniref:zinc finger protein 335-like n=1 Tax=Eriocheir sinensis TaxID=95602 RepID=UPI0021CABFE4|nr:zinc finger protein 335-like [Eriocheir sinensis]